MIIKCPECGAEISDKAVLCPKCGCPIKKQEEKPEKKFYGVFIAIICAVGFIVAMALYSSYYRSQQEQDVERTRENTERVENEIHKNERIINDMKKGTWDPDKDYEQGFGHK